MLIEVIKNVLHRRRILNRGKADLPEKDALTLVKKGFARIIRGSETKPETKQEAGKEALDPDNQAGGPAPESTKPPENPPPENPPPPAEPSKAKSKSGK